MMRTRRQGAARLLEAVEAPCCVRRITGRTGDAAVRRVRDARGDDGRSRERERFCGPSREVKAEVGGVDGSAENMGSTQPLDREVDVVGWLAMVFI